MNRETVRYLKKAISWLIEKQKDDGSRAVSLILKIPPLNIIKADQFGGWKVNKYGTGVVIDDKNGIFATSAVLWALPQHRWIA